MSQARNGDTVKVHFTGRLENGEVFSKPKEDEPFEFTLGSGELIPGFEKGIVGMEVGETKIITALHLLLILRALVQMPLPGDYGTLCCEFVNWIGLR